MHATLLSVQPLTSTVGLLRVQPPEALHRAFLKPGQYQRVGLVGEKQTHLALASAPTHQPFEYLVRAQGEVAKTLLASPAGTQLALGPIEGRGFHVEATGDQNLLLVGTGTGFGPLRALGVWLAERGSLSRVTMLWGLRDETQLAQRLEWHLLAERGATFVTTFSQPEAGWAGRSGYVDAHWREWLTPGTIVYACGQTAMVERLRADAEAAQCGPVFLNV